MGESDPLLDLHEAYVWKVNAAVAEGRMDLVREFAEEYTDEALQLMTTLHPSGCGRPGCAVCARDRSRPTAQGHRRRFWRRHPSDT